MSASQTHIHDSRPAEAAEPPEGVEPLLSADAIAAWLGCSASTVHDYTRRDGLPFVRLPRGRKRFLRSAVQEWLDARKAVIQAELATVEVEPVARPAPRSREGSSWRSELRAITSGQ